eukprot:UN08067
MGIIYIGKGLDGENASMYTPGLAYGHSKFANVVFTEELARQITERNDNILCNAVHPGFVDTELTRHMSDKP